MSMGRREPQQDPMLVPAIRGPSHIFYDRLNAQLDERKFDLKVEAGIWSTSASGRRRHARVPPPDRTPAGRLTAEPP